MAAVHVVVERLEGQYDEDEGPQGTAEAFLEEGAQVSEEDQAHWIHWDEGLRGDQEASETGVKLKLAVHTL